MEANMVILTSKQKETLNPLYAEFVRLGFEPDAFEIGSFLTPF